MGRRGSNKFKLGREGRGDSICCLQYITIVPIVGGGSMDLKLGNKKTIVGGGGGVHGFKIGE